METIAIFGDIHGNLSALDAVLADMDQRGLQTRYCLGDLVGYGTFPNEVVDRIRQLGIPTIMGNYDQGVGLSSDDCGCAYRTDEARALGEQSIQWTNEHTTDNNKAFLRALLDRIALKLGGFDVLLVHGSPRKINEYLYEDQGDARFKRIFDQVQVDVLVCGHTHLPYHKILPDGQHMINAGSVGKPKDGDPRAGYITLTATADTLKVEFIRVSYDVEATARAIEASTMPNVFADMLRTATG